MPLRQPLDAVIPAELAGLEGRSVEIPAAEQEAAGMNQYLMRTYGAATDPDFTLYVGYYESQTQGRTIHSPRNCLPGAGWEALDSRHAVIALPGGEVRVNRYMIQRGSEQALVLYWYQGRGRVAASEYRVKLDLLRDAALRGRSEEALVRVMVPVRSTEAEAYELATRIAATVVPALDHALPAA
jgi:EpsI family protein